MSETINIDVVWPESLGKLKGELSDQSFSTWFEPLVCLEISSETIRLGAADKFTMDWLKDHYQGLIASTVADVLGVETKPFVAFEIVDQPKKPEVETPPAAEEEKPISVQLSSAPPPPQTDRSSLNSNYTFDNFVVGSGSRFAQAASFAVAESPAKRYNPLFIYGSVGLGKTHLMQAIAHEMMGRNPGAKALYVSSEKFVNHLVQSIQNRTQVAFRNKYRGLDILLIDDIHFIAGKEATQEEFFHTFNTLHDAHKQIVVSSDRPPKDIPGLEDRLVSRFQWGLVVDIQPPDFETRLAILKKKLLLEKTDVPDDVLEFIASKIKSNIRELEGALRRVIAYTSLTGALITLTATQDILKDSLVEEAGKITIDVVQRKVAEYYGISVSDMRVKKRSKTIAFPRQIAMYLVRELTDHSLPEIGQYFGGRDHTTILHAYNKIQKDAHNNPTTKQAVEVIKRSLLA